MGVKRQRFNIITVVEQNKGAVVNGVKRTALSTQKSVLQDFH